MNTHLCRIESALGRSTPCPAERCSLWQDGACVVAGLSADLAKTPGLAELLLDVRGRLDEARASSDALVLPGLR